jgi:hypothetical protein
MTTTNWLMLFRKIIAVYSENHMKRVNILCVGKVQIDRLNCTESSSNCRCNCSSGQQIVTLSRNTKVHGPIHKIPPTNPFFSQLK